MKAIVVPSPSTAASTWPTWSPTSALALTVMPGLAVGADLELHDVGRLVGDERRRTDGPQELLAVEDGPRRVLLRHDLLVVRELAVDQPAHEVDAVEVEQDLVATAGQDDLDRVVDIGQDPGELVEGAGRDDDARLGDGVEDRDGLDRDPVVVGGRQGQLVALEPGQDPGQDGSSLVARRGERRLVERPSQDVLGDARGRALAGGLDRRELLGVDALDVGLEPTAAEVERLARAQLEVDLVAGRQRVDEVGQELGRDGRRAVGLDLAGHPVGDADLEVRGGQLQPGVLGLEQDVGQDRQGAPARHGTADDGQAARQVLLHHRESHVGFTPKHVVMAGDATVSRMQAVGERSRTGLPGGPRGVVGIFSLSSHPVIITIRVWSAWTLRCGAARG